MKLTKTIMAAAEEIRCENHNILNPKVYTKHRVEDKKFTKRLQKMMKTKRRVDFVLFSSRSGAEPHIDKHLKHLTKHTYIIPVILPATGATMTTPSGIHQLKVGRPVKINHQEMHSLEVLEETGCVVIMASKYAKEKKHENNCTMVG